MSDEAFNNMQKTLNQVLRGTDSPFGNNSSIAEVYLKDVLFYTSNTAEMTIRMYLKEKPKRYTWLWIAEWSSGDVTHIRSENNPWLNSVSDYYFKEPERVYKIEESKQETSID